jgi:DNA-binding transcriptional LysR family regulator
VFDDFEAFAVFARHRNFTRAASELHLSQPALHMRVRKLALAVGRPLYRREGRSLVLTPEGERVAQFANERMVRQEALFRELREPPARTPIRLASHDAGHLHILPGGIRAFGRGRDRSLQLLELGEAEIIDAVGEGRADLAVTVVDGDRADLVRVPVGRYAQVAIMRNDHALARRTTLRVADLQGQPLIVPPLGTRYRKSLSRSLAVAGVRWEVALETDQAHLMHHFAALRVGIAIRTVCARLERSLVAVPITDLPSIEWSAVYCRKASSDAELLELVRLIGVHAPRGLPSPRRARVR